MHVTLQTLSVNPRTRIWFFRARLCLACGHQYNRCAGLGEVAGGPPQRERTETTPLEPRAISSEYGTLFVKRCTTPLCLCRRHYRAKIALHAGIVVSRNPPQAPLLAGFREMGVGWLF